MNKDGNKINPVRYQGWEPVGNFFVVEILNKNSGRRLPRTSLASPDQSLQKFWILLDTGKQEMKIPRVFLNYSAVTESGRPGYKGREIQKFGTEPQGYLAWKAQNRVCRQLRSVLQKRQMLTIEKTLNNGAGSSRDCPNRTWLISQITQISKVLEFSPCKEKKMGKFHLHHKAGLNLW